jgi:RimJ/RimL family protein N-acetyltransferase
MDDLRGKIALETRRPLLRRLQPTDMDAYYRGIYADPEMMRTLPARVPISRAELEARVPGFMIDHWTAHGFGPWPVIYKADQRFIGHCGLRYWPGSPDVEVFYALDKRYWGGGLATEGARASLRYGFEHLVRVVRAPRIRSAEHDRHNAFQRG